jgi:hypothetical protein
LETRDITLIIRLYGLLAGIFLVCDTSDSTGTPSTRDIRRASLSEGCVNPLRILEINGWLLPRMAATWACVVPVPSI